MYLLLPHHPLRAQTRLLSQEAPTLSLHANDSSHYILQAVRHVLPQWGQQNPKADWLNDFDRSLAELSVKESRGTLNGDKKRHRAYAGVEPLCIFDPGRFYKDRNLPQLAQIHTIYFIFTFHDIIFADAEIKTKYDKLFKSSLSGPVIRKVLFVLHPPPPPFDVQLLSSHSFPLHYNRMFMTKYIKVAGPNQLQIFHWVLNICFKSYVDHIIIVSITYFQLPEYVFIAKYEPASLQ